MCLMVYANGNGEGAGTHVSVYVYLMRGEHDDKLTWPFHGYITIQLLNQSRDQDHVEYTLAFGDKAARKDASGRVTVGERAMNGWGVHKFISHTNLFIKQYLKQYLITKQYIKNDCIKFRVTAIVHST